MEEAEGGVSNSAYSIAQRQMICSGIIVANIRIRQRRHQEK